MARVKFDLGNGTTTTVPSPQHPMVTQRGTVEAGLVAMGDKICIVAGDPLIEVVSPPELEE